MFCYFEGHNRILSTDNGHTKGKFIYESHSDPDVFSVSIALKPSSNNRCKKSVEFKIQ